MIAATTKPLVMTAGGVETVEPMWRMACEVRGGEQALRDKPYFVMYNQPVSPLKHPFETVDKLLFCADKGVPSTYCPSPVAGGTAPITTAGQITLGVAEALFGLVMHQLRAPGAPFVIGQGPNTLDMATSQSSYNSPEFIRAYAWRSRWPSGWTSPTGASAATPTRRSWTPRPAWRPTRSPSSPCSWAPTSTTTSATWTSASPARSPRSCWWPSSSPGTGSCSRRSRSTTRRSPWTCSRPSAPAATSSASATRGATCATTSGARKLLNRASYDRWAEGGALDATEKARQKARELLATHEVAPLPDGLAGQLDAVVPAG